MKLVVQLLSCSQTAEPSVRPSPPSHDQKRQPVRAAAAAMAFAIDDTKKIGTLLLGIGFLFLLLGVMLFFDSGLLSIGDILVLSGLFLIIGPSKLFRFFCKKERFGGTLTFFGGIVLVICRWAMLGMAVQAWGFLNLFGRFFPVAITFLRATPGIGNVLNLPVISTILDKLSGAGGGSNLPY